MNDNLNRGVEIHSKESHRLIKPKCNHNGILRNHSVYTSCSWT